MARTVMLPSGQKVVVLSVPEAMDRLACEIDELGEWVASGQIHGCKCPNCGLSYPVEADIDDLVQFAEQFPTNVPMGEIVEERVRTADRRGSRKVTREVESDPRASSRTMKNPRTTQAQTRRYEEEDDDHRAGAFQRFLPGGRRR